MDPRGQVQELQHLAHAGADLMKSLFNFHFGLDGTKLVFEISFSTESLFLIELDARLVGALLFLAVIAFTRDSVSECLMSAL